MKTDPVPENLSATEPNHDEQISEDAENPDTVSYSEMKEDMTETFEEPVVEADKPPAKTWGMRFYAGTGNLRFKSDEENYRLFE